MPSLNSINYTLAVLTIVGLVGGWWVTGKGKRKAEAERAATERARREAADNAILGTAEVRDDAGNLLEVGRPGLVARTTSLERAVSVLADQGARLTNHDARLTAQDARLDGHDSAIGALIANQFDAGAKASLDAVEKANKDAIDVDPDGD